MTGRKTPVYLLTYLLLANYGLAACTPSSPQSIPQQKQKKKEKERERQAGRQAGRQTGRQTERERERQIDRQADRKTEKVGVGQRERERATACVLVASFKVSRANGHAFEAKGWVRERLRIVQPVAHFHVQTLHIVQHVLHHRAHPAKHVHTAACRHNRQGGGEKRR